MLKKIQELGKISTKKIILCSILSIISGLSGFSFIALINKIIENYISKNHLDMNYFYGISFVIILMVFFVSRRLLSGIIINFTQDIHWNIRTEVIRSVLKASPDLVETKREEIYSTMTNDVGNIVSGSVVIIELVSSFVLILFSFFYMMYLSLKISLISIVIIILCMILYFFRMKKSSKKFNDSRDLEKDFIRYFNNILYGIKEIKLNSKIGKKNLSKIERIALKAKKNDKGAIIGYLNTQIITQVFFYLLIIFILFNGVAIINAKIEIVISFVFVLLYLTGPVTSVMSIVPIINRTIVSLNRITILKKEFISNNEEFIFNNDLKTEEFIFLEFKDLQFTYPTSNFSIGPINLMISKGEIIFIYGGNGNGKTTLLNTLLNLNKSNKGTFFLNGKKCDFGKDSKFKELFSPVFSDFYLFDEFYGIDTINIDEAKYYLKIFELENKVSIIDNKFSTIDLSTGQRKRLALINALLENKPILILDEWAADQDPIFRKKFYNDIIPLLKHKGFTILAITHDDKYYNCADRLFRMEYGNLIEE